LIRNVDFVIAGGGPAGCTFAILAARAGASVILVERGDYLKRRPGEHLAGRIRASLDELRVSPDDARVTSVASPGILSLWNGRPPLTKPYAASGQPDALCVCRHRFDALLFRSAADAGAVAVSGAALGNTTRSRHGGWHVSIKGPEGNTFDVRARSVVDASGRNAIFARSQEARRIHRGDLIAIVGWLKPGNCPIRPRAMLTVESCPVGWWSLSSGADEALVATLYTSSQMIKTASVAYDMWWAHALGKTRSVAGTLRNAGAMLIETAVYAAFPSRLSKMFGDGWIAIGDAAVAFDPVAGQGVAMAMDTAFRAFEAASVDPSFRVLGPNYADALIDRFERHLKGRARVYEAAAPILSVPFLNFAVSREQLRTVDTPAPYIRSH
jgi:flavin-dependent dehydrogenase